ncbi:MAG: hypothetical protein GYB37_08720 [Algicola sp.]|nr:hypothetical protein [Algicola sp.]
MKFKTMYYLLCSMLFLLFSCDNTDDGDEQSDMITNVQGTIRLTGEETSELGTTLTVGNVEVGNVALSGTDKSVILMSENITIVDNQLVYKDDQNGFVIVAADFTTGGSPNIEKSISMVIVRDGVEYRHACTSPYQNFFIACGEGYEVDFEAKTIVLEETTVINTDNDTILTLDGIVSWN